MTPQECFAVFQIGACFGVGATIGATAVITFLSVVSSVVTSLTGKGES